MKLSPYKYEERNDEGFWFSRPWRFNSRFLSC